jgi:hypothetical protein
MHRTILALATAGALAGTALPAVAWDRDDDNGYYRHRDYRDHNYNYRPYYRPHYGRYDDYENWRRHEAYRNWWWKHHRYDIDRPWIRKD